MKQAIILGEIAIVVLALLAGCISAPQRAVVNPPPVFKPMDSSEAGVGEAASLEQVVQNEEAPELLGVCPGPTYQVRLVCDYQQAYKRRFPLPMKRPVFGWPKPDADCQEGALVEVCLFSLDFPWPVDGDSMAKEMAKVRYQPGKWYHLISLFIDHPNSLPEMNSLRVVAFGSTWRSDSSQKWMWNDQWKYFIDGNSESVEAIDLVMIVARWTGIMALSGKPEYEVYFDFHKLESKEGFIWSGLPCISRKHRFIGVRIRE